MSRIGIFAGSFDPVHKGHIKFALVAAKQAKLDKVYFLIEAKPRYKSGVTHLAHRLAMLKITLKAHTSLDVLDFPDRQFSVAKTLPRLNHKFPNDDLFLICGTDVLSHLASWPLATALLKRIGLVVGIRKGIEASAVETLIEKLPHKPRQVLIIPSPMPALSSGAIRESLLLGKPITGLEPAVAQYIKANWLYASPSNSISAS